MTTPISRPSGPTQWLFQLPPAKSKFLQQYQIISSHRVITCVFAGPRKWIYEVFQSRLLE